MSKYLEFNTPATKQALDLASDFRLKNQGLTNLDRVFWNLPNEALYEEIIFRNEGKLAKHGALLVNTGKHTARAAADKFVVREESTAKDIWWGAYNRPYAHSMWSQLMGRFQAWVQGEELFVQDCYVGADP
ncbi:MAG: phosphoenolpyruvate carboxykinase (ATP), partial [Bacteroidota bacterium]